MSRVRVYIENAYFGEAIEINDRDILHKLKEVLRLSKGKQLYIFDGRGKECSYDLDFLDKKQCILKKVGSVICQEQPALKLAIGFPLMVEDKVDFILQKCTELGVDCFFPFICRRSRNQSIGEKKVIRWKKIIAEAVRQSNRRWFPGLVFPMRFEDLINTKYENKVVSDFKGSYFKDSETCFDKDTIVVIGPEGDFDSDEYRDLNRQGFKPIKLSEATLRTETAVVFAAGLFSLSRLNRN
ncbi:MAG: RsmE family RNA methyltransferase [Candidatus Omnitrophica bacterium]|nr:RsmE family RNA methyltransferase [Candidatus Omnitrophota bacterium]